LSAKYYAKRILKGIGKFLYYFGKGLWSITKSFGKNIGIAYRNYEKRQRIEEIRRAHYRGLEHENYVAGRGWARGVADAQEEDRIRRRDECDRRAALRRFENSLYDVPKVNDDFFVQEFEPNRRKRKRNILEL